MNVPLANNTQLEFKFSPMKESFVLSKLQTLNPRKGIGVNEISNRMLKAASPVIARPLTKTFNQLLETGTFPSGFKIGQITALHKSGDRPHPSNYRPISVLTALSKILEKAVRDQLYTFPNSNKIISDSQSGFRPKHSTITALTRFTHQIYRNIGNRKATTVPWSCQSFWYQKPRIALGKT